MTKRVRNRAIFSAAAVISERLENRCLLSATTFTIVPASSPLTVAIKATYDGININLTSQGTSSLNSSQNSLTTELSGTVLASVGSNTLQFDSGSSIAAEVNGSWKPGDNPDGESSNYNTALPANFGATASIIFVGTEYVALRGLVLDGQSPVMQQSGGGYNTNNALTVTVTAGDAYYDGSVSGAVGTSDLTGNSANNGSGQLATLSVNGSTETLTVPIDVVFSDTAGTTPITATFTGTLVATATATVIPPSSSYYLKLDADGQHMDLYNNSTGAGAIAAQFLLSQQSSLALTTTGGAGSITIDNSAGNVIPSGGLTLTGDGSTSLLIIGSGKGDTVTQNAGQILFNSLPIDFTDIRQISLNPDGGTDTLAVNSSTLDITAAPAGQGIIERSFSSISVASGAELQVLTAASHSDRTLLLVHSLSIAGATSAWTGTLDLGGNDMDAVGGSLATLTNQIAQGYDNGVWSGHGIVSSSAAGNSTHLTTLGVLLNNNGSGGSLYGSGAALGLFDGYSPAVTDVLVKYTYYGDANLDGKVNASDYSLIDNGILNHLTGWYNGDFNYDGTVNGSDYTLIDNAFNTQAAPLTEIADSDAAISSSGTSTRQPVIKAALAGALPTVFNPGPAMTSPGPAADWADELLQERAKETVGILFAAATSTGGKLP